MPSAALPRRCYIVHGVWVCVTSASPALLLAVDDLLTPFTSIGTPAGGRAAIALRLSEAEAPPFPEQRSEWFTYPPLRCTTDATHGYTEYDGHCVARLALATGALDVWAPPRLGIERWMLGHAVILPLLVEALRSFGLSSLHAAALADGPRAVLLPGESRSGKSTLALALVRGGFALLSDDAPFARRDAESITLCAFPEPINVTRESAHYFAEIAARWSSGVPDARGKVGLTVADVGAHVAQEAPAALVLFPTVGEEDRSRVAPLAKADALRHLLGASMPAATAAQGAEQFLLLADLVRQADCYTLAAGRDFDAIPALVRSLLHARQHARALIRTRE